ncbi:MAG: urea transporter [Candidatus Cloacimonetes bacterium]|nr:urea transporter [Candidatus Cloacimonadota bacterium]MDD4790742.1 urea transporter [Candidatus Cloacimonadota bacterium]
MKKAHLFAFAKAIPNAYATVLYSDSMGIGLGMMALTFLSPIVGLAGFFTLICAMLTSRLLGFEDWDSKSGILSFNSLLIGMAIAYYYPYSGMGTLSGHFFALLVIASLVTLFLYVAVNYLCLTTFKIPSMSLAFSISAVFFWYYLVRSGNFSGLNFQKPLLFSPNLQLGAYWRSYFLSLGSIMFVPDVLAGILLALVLFMITRIGFLLSLVGWSICWLLLGYVNMGDTYGMFFPGFNLILISLAIGSVYLIPGKSSYLLAVFATIAGFLLAYAMSGKFYYSDFMSGRPLFLYLPIFAFPVNIVVITMIYALKLRIRPRSPVMNDYGILHPEKALDTYLSGYRRFSNIGIPQLEMPVAGQWLVTQGHHGKHTHKEEWALAWDFEIEDKQGKKFSDEELTLSDYYSYGKSVYAAAAGYVAKVVNSIPDNSIGDANTIDNWGNYVSISHGYGFYSLYAHLKEGSVKLSEGDYVKVGEKIAQVGNSGRSFVPHLHFQAQAGAEAGSRSLYCNILNYKQACAEGGYRFVASGIPQEGEMISALIPEKDLANILQIGYGQSQTFAVKSNNGNFTEQWKTDLDLLGKHYLVSDAKAKLGFSVYHGIFNALDLTGNRNSALAAFAYAAGRIPWAEKQSLTWQDEPSLSVTMNKFWKNLTLFLIPFFKPIRVESDSCLSSDGDGISLESITHLYVFGMKLRQRRATIDLDRKHGIRSIRLFDAKGLILTATHFSSEETNNV